MIYFYYVLTYGGDSIGYYLASKHELRDFEFGTIAVQWFTSLLTQFLHFSFLSCFLLFNFFGLIGLLALDGAIKSVNLVKTAQSKLIINTSDFIKSKYELLFKKKIVEFYMKF